MPEEFALGEALPGGPVPPGSNVLVSGGRATAPRRVALSILDAGFRTGEPAIVVSADRSARQLGREYAESFGADPDPELFRVVNCSGTSAESEYEREWVSSPGDLTGIGMGVVKAGRDIAAADPTRVAVLSLSTILQYGSLDRTFSFTHVLSGRIAAEDRLGVFTLDPTTHEERAVNSLTSLFDRVCELRERDGTREARVVGGPRGATAWKPF
ncbi:MAG: RAD55 family ATPase [Halobacteriaceae archaeon]